MISAKDNLCDAIDAMGRIIEGLQDRFDRLERNIGIREKFTLDDLCRRYSGNPDKPLSRDTLTRAPWRLPNYGRSDFGEGRKYWFRETVEAWEAYGFERHREDWERMSAAEKRKALGVAA